jgi:uncharacterized protein (DUF2062 family)
MKSLTKIMVQKLAKVKNKLTGLNAEPHQVAMGYALGIFLAATPFIGLKVFIAMALTFIFKWNKVAAIFGVFHINFLTGPVFYGFSYIVGSSVLGADVSGAFNLSFTMNSLHQIFTTNTIVFVSLLAGGIILGLPMAIAAYFISNSFFNHKIISKPNAL